MRNTAISAPLPPVGRCGELFARPPVGAADDRLPLGCCVSTPGTPGGFSGGIETKHASPNSAQTESVCAGALHVRLAGSAVYFGRLVEKPTIGDDDRPIEPDDIRRANRLMGLTALLAVLLAAGVRLALELWRL